MAPEISVLIHTRDSAATIGACLASVAWSDDVVVLDMASTDETCAIAVAAGARVVALPAETWSDAIRNRHLGEASHPWTLILDSDERLADDGGRGIAELLEHVGSEMDAFAVPRFNTVAGQVMRGSGFSPDHQWRLFRTGAVVYSEAHHQPPVIRDGYSRLHVIDPATGPRIHHEHYPSLRELILRQARYAATDRYDADAFDLGAYAERIHAQLAQRTDPEADGDLSRAIAAVLAWDGVIRALMHWETLEPRPPLGAFPALPIGTVMASAGTELLQGVAVAPGVVDGAPQRRQPPPTVRPRQSPDRQWVSAGAEHALQRAWAAHRVHRYQETIIVRRAFTAPLGTHVLDEVIADRPAAEAAATPIEDRIVRTRSAFVRRAVARSLRRRMVGGGEYPIPLLRGVAWFTDGGIDASVVIPFHEQFELTLQCLEAASITAIDVAVEFIVVDDGSTLDRSVVFADVPGVTYVRLTQQSGFIAAANAGAAHARGRTIVLLNNDTIPQRGWLEALLEELDANPAVGIVGALLLQPDGRIAEAGAMLRSDGVPRVLGTGLDVGTPPFNRPADVDYVSGACLALRAEFWRELGGLDARYAPAYYDDVDLCMAARVRGLRVRMRSDARVVHLASQSYGAMGSARKDVLIALAHRQFRRKWAGPLATIDDDGFAVDMPRRGTRGSILIVDLQLPRGDLEGGSARMLEIIRSLLRDNWDVVFLPADLDAESPAADALRNQGIRIVGGVQAAVDALPQPPAAILLSRPESFGAYALLLMGTWPGAALIYDTVDLHAERLRSQTALRGDGHARFADVVGALEQAAFVASDLTLAVTEEESAIVRAQVPTADIALVPVMYRCAASVPPRAGRHGAVFVGGYRHAPNIDAAVRLGTRIHPAIRRARPDETLTIAGPFPPAEVVVLGQQAGVAVTGWVEDLDELHGAAVALLAPIDWGAGINSKIVSAMAAGLPVVTTPLGATGLGAIDGEDILVGESDDELVELYLRLVSDDALWERVSQNGQALVRERFEPDVATAPLRAWLADRVDGTIGGVKRSGPTTMLGAGS